MKQILLFWVLLPLLLHAQKDPDSSKLRLPQGLKENLKSILPNVQPAVNPMNNQHAYRTLPWLHRFLDTASEQSINRFLSEGNDSILQLTQYETMSARHAYSRDNPRSTNDKDGDGTQSIESGGGDCDDLDNDSYRGNPERCSGYRVFSTWGKKYIIINKYHDEDCDPTTVAGAKPDGDEDGDKQICFSCLNYSPRIPVGSDPAQVAIIPTPSAISLGNPNRSYTVRGYDCDDHNPALIRASQICIDARTIAVCENGKWRYYPCIRCVRQPNGSGVVME